MIAQIAVFSRKTDAQRKKNFAFRSPKIAQKFCEWKPYRQRFPNSRYYSQEQHESSVSESKNGSRSESDSENTVPDSPPKFAQGKLNLMVF